MTRTCNTQRERERESGSIVKSVFMIIMTTLQMLMYSTLNITNDKFIKLKRQRRKRRRGDEEEE